MSRSFSKNSHCVVFIFCGRVARVEADAKTCLHGLDVILPVREVAGRTDAVVSRLRLELLSALEAWPQGELVFRCMCTALAIPLPPGLRFVASIAHDTSSYISSAQHGSFTARRCTAGSMRGFCPSSCTHLRHVRCEKSRDGNGLWHRWQRRPATCVRSGTGERSLTAVLMCLSNILAVRKRVHGLQ